MVLTSTSIAVRWMVLLEVERNGIITDYEVSYSYSGGDSASNTTELSLELKDLAEAEIYSIQVRAYTSVGPGPYSIPPQLVMTQEDGMDLDWGG